MKRERLKDKICLFFCVYAFGLTIGSCLSAGIDFEIPVRVTPYWIFIRDIFFLFLVNLWGRRPIRYAGGILALVLKGAFMGAASVQIIRQYPIKYIGLFLPQTILLIPAMVAFLCANTDKNIVSFRLSSIIIKALLIFLVNFLISCVQFAFYTYFPQFY